MKKKLKYDLYRIKGRFLSKFEIFREFFLHHEVRFLYFYRNDNNVIMHVLLRNIRKKYGLEIYSKQIGGGLYLAHPYMITVNTNAKIGSNCNLSKGCTIGAEFRGERKGSPTIGNNVWIGANSTIVGNIKIGNNVLIAPNTFVNKDVESDSIVFGNPCIIKKNTNATDKYINNFFNEIE